MTHTRWALPDAPGGAILNHERGFFTIIVPEATTNLVTNPSVEIATTGYTATNSASIARSTTQQRRGVYSLAVTPTGGNSNPSGVQWDVSITTGATYTLSVDLYGVPGQTYRLAWMSDAAAATATPLAASQVIVQSLTARWLRLSVSYPASASTAYDLRLERTGSANTGIFYTDGWQVEQKSYATTYCDGDQAGLVASTPPAYTWSGTAHASTSSRTAQTRAGGREMRLQEDYGFWVTGYQGLGLAEPRHITQAYALLDGANYQRTMKEPRTFQITGGFLAATPDELRRKRAALSAVLDRDRATPDSPLLLRFRVWRCNDPTSEEIDLPCLYAGGLEGDHSSDFGQMTALRFLMPDPALRSAGQAGGTIDISDSFGTPVVATRTGDETWTDITGSLVSAGVNELLYGPDGLLYAADNTDVKRWNGASWTTIGDFNASVLSFAFGPNGYLYVGGTFTAEATVATCNRIAVWDGSTWAELGGGVTTGTSVLAIVVDGTEITIGGAFTQVGGATAVNNVAMWDGATWDALSGGVAGGGVSALAFYGDILIAGGAFTTPLRIAHYTGAAWAVLGASGANNTVLALCSAGGYLYAGGDFSSIAGMGIDGIARWNGVAWSALGAGIDASATIGSVIAEPSGAIYVGGSTFTVAGGIRLPASIARWSGAQWSPVLINDTTDTNPFENNALNPTSGVLAVGLNALAGPFTIPGRVTVPEGTGASPVRVQFTRSAGTSTTRIHALLNLTRGTTILFTELTISLGETITLTSGTNASLVSTTRSNLLSTIVPGTLASFLIRGGDILACLVAGDTGNVTATYRYTPTYATIDEATDA